MILKGSSLQTKLSRLFLSSVFFLSGCAAAYTPSPLPVNHPANPAALEASPPPSSQAFGKESPLPTSMEAPPQHTPHVKHDAAHGGH